ncbi:carbohydrate ABC transporter permease [Paenibacillus chondroitinus]|uniref:Carbohydrate ABC transporter permease n=1 Tax=Paenibacillus chondroitinus TaxID=59842 RepID=A0ABU6D963_9BACL|nr:MULTISPECIES: carbohydrate ABC transporter permease [Paenibacillus]MCY9656630.1 carbohydrate ABC transporter permease [Paenibacillus anseongense]MEB4794279.1 carbohydrate ABC transporter permease [Paenibacillus chondroitinus]
MSSTSGEKLFYTINYVVLFVIGMSCLLPLVHILAMSLSDKHALMSGVVSLWPVNLDFSGYEALFKETPILRSLANSFIITVVGTVLNISFTVLAAYPLSKRYFIGRKFYSFAIIFTMLFSAGLIPTYLLLKSLGLLNNYGALWLPGLVSVWNLMVLRSFFEALPEELEEASRIDGCSEWRLIIQIVLPLSIPVVAALSLFYGVSHWNAFMNVLIYINDASKLNLTVLVQQLIQNQTLMQEMANTQPEMAMKLTPEGMKAAGVIVMTLPMLIVYPFLQKYFVKGVMIGAVKG